MLMIPLLFLLFLQSASAFDFSNDFKTSVSGQIKWSLGVSSFTDSSIQSEFQENAWYDEGMDLRINSTTFFSDNASFEFHYLLSSSWGDTIEASRFYEQQYPGTILSHRFRRNFDEDDTSLVDFSSKIKEGERWFSNHRIDRFNLVVNNRFGRVTIGRQAVTWGNGLVFNPMDLFSPFSPYDTQRDYKKGEDSVHFETFLENGNEIEFLYVPRRPAEGRSVKVSSSSAAAKYHIYLNDMEFDLMAAGHYEDIVFGIGYMTPAGSAMLRGDVIYSHAGGDMENNLLNIVMNIDYSWVWFKKNFYGCMEYYYSSLGAGDDYSEMFTDHDLVTRSSRGEIYGFAKNYLSSNLQMEINPLLNLRLLVIANLDDPSSLIQPVLTFSAARNIEIILGSNIAIGGRGDEYGQIPIPLSDETIDTASNIFFRFTLFF